MFEHGLMATTVWPDPSPASTASSSSGESDIIAPPSHTAGHGDVHGSHDDDDDAAPMDISDSVGSSGRGWDDLRAQLAFVIEPLAREGEERVEVYDMHEDMLARLNREW